MYRDRDTPGEEGLGSGASWDVRAKSRDEIYPIFGCRTGVRVVY